LVEVDGEWSCFVYGVGVEWVWFEFFVVVVVSVVLFDELGVVCCGIVLVLSVLCCSAVG